MPAERYQLIVDVVTLNTRSRNAASHPWHRSSRHGVVTVERAPGVSRDAASRPMTPEEREARDRPIIEAWERGEGSALDIARRLGVTRGVVSGVVHRAGVTQGTRQHDRPPTAAEIARERRNGWILRLLGASWSVLEVCEFVDASGDTVRGVRNRARAAGTLPPPVPTRATCRPATTVVACQGVDRVSLLDARAGQCRSLESDGLCCCAPVVPSRSWCRDHLHAYTQRPTRRAA